MQIQTRFALGQRVHRIGRQKEDPIVLPCKFCRGSSRIRVDSPSGSEHAYVACPRCGGNGRARLATRLLFTHLGEATIGKIRLEILDPRVDGFNGGTHFGSERGRSVDERGYVRDESYMINSTGFPSGSIFYDVDMFATREEADAEIEKRNADIISGESWKPDRRDYEACRAFLDHADVYEHTDEHIRIAEEVVCAYEHEPDDE